MKFSAEVLSHGISSASGELAWKREYVFRAIDELIENEFAILGGEVWALVEENEFESKIPPLTRIDSKTYALGAIDCKDGETSVFGWETEKELSETWDQYLLRTKKETILSIEELNVENEVVLKYKNSIYYHLIYANKKKFKNIR